MGEIATPLEQIEELLGVDHVHSREGYNSKLTLCGKDGGVFQVGENRLSVTCQKCLTLFREKIFVELEKHRTRSKINEIYIVDYDQRLVVRK